MAVGLLTGATISGPDLALAIRSDFMTTYRQAYDGVLANIGDVMQLAVPSQDRIETFGYRETMPYPEFWRQGDPVPQEGTDAKRYSVTNYTYAKRLAWHRDDRADNQVGDLLADARTMGQNYASLPSRAFAQAVFGSAGPVPVFPTAPDGAVLFSATDGGGGARFGVTGGNLITGGTVATAALVTTDVFKAFAQFEQFLNTKGEPLYEPDLETEAYTIYFGSKNLEVFNEAFKSMIIHSVESTTGAGVSNVIMASGVKVKLISTPRETTDDFYVFRTDAQTKAVFETDRMPIEEESALSEGNNSDSVRNTGEEYVQYRVRKGFGINLPIAAIKINN